MIISNYNNKILKEKIINNNQILFIIKYLNLKIIIISNNNNNIKKDKILNNNLYLFTNKHNNQIILIHLNTLLKNHQYINLHLININKIIKNKIRNHQSQFINKYLKILSRKNHNEIIKNKNSNNRNKKIILI